MEDPLLVVRRMASATEYVHGLVSTMLPAVILSSARGQVSLKDVSSEWIHQGVDEEVRSCNLEAAHTLHLMNIDPSSEEGVALVVFATRTAALVVFCASLMNADPTTVWQRFIRQYSELIGDRL